MADLGIDIHCVDDIDPNFALVSGQKVLAQALARRLITPRGTLLEDPEYGFDLRAFLNDTHSAFRVESGIESELLKDERVDDVSATTTYDELSGRLTVEARVTSSEGPFDFILGVTDVTVELVTPTL